MITSFITRTGQALQNTWTGMSNHLSQVDAAVQKRAKDWFNGLPKGRQDQINQHVSAGVEIVKRVQRNFTLMPTNKRFDLALKVIGVVFLVNFFMTASGAGFAPLFVASAVGLGVGIYDTYNCYIPAVATVMEGFGQVKDVLVNRSPDF
jgi:hypothetical protein